MGAVVKGYIQRVHVRFVRGIAYMYVYRKRRENRRWHGVQTLQEIDGWRWSYEGELRSHRSWDLVWAPSAPHNAFTPIEVDVKWSSSHERYTTAGTVMINIVFSHPKQGTRECDEFRYYTMLCRVLKESNIAIRSFLDDVWICCLKNL